MISTQRLTHSLQMNTFSGPATILLTSVLDLPQKLQTGSLLGTSGLDAMTWV